MIRGFLLFLLEDLEVSKDFEEQAKTVNV